MANRVCAHEARRWSTCSDTENLRLKVTPRISMVSTRVNPGTAGGGISASALLLDGTKTTLPT